ncbi:MAG TPA: HIT domain-containing protein [Candidatus Paceibacterota bacterium]|nr:HIT domain-containing protein [Candidatus Paceibacterota bacterium]
MYNHEPKGYVCPLCQIANGEPTSIGSQEDSVLLRDSRVVVFIAGKWWRSNPGHVIIMPRRHIENIYDMPDYMAHRISDYAKVVALALKKGYGCDGVSTRQHNEPAGNQDVWHYHLHVQPRWTGDNLYLRHEDTYWPTAEEKQPYVEKLRPFLP